MSGRGRGVVNTPAWMTRQAPPPNDDGPHPPPPSSSAQPLRRSRSRSPPQPSSRRRSRSRSPPRNDRGPPPRTSYRSRGPPPRSFGPSSSSSSRRSQKSSYGHGGGGHHHSNNNHHHQQNDGLYFSSLAEERAWAEDRRKKRRARQSLFDIPPTPEQLAAEAAAAECYRHGTTGGNNSSSYGVGVGSDKKIATQPQQTRHARRLYIGQLPADVSEADVHLFFKDSVATAMGTAASGADDSDEGSSSDPILSVYINHERRFAFVEFRTMEVCTACLALDGINLLGKGKVKVKRPNDYNPSLAPPETQLTNLPQFDVSKLGIVSGSVPDGPNKIFIGGLPYHLTEDQVLELLSAFGPVRAFHLVKADAAAVTSKGYSFVEYADPNVTPIAVMGLNGMNMGGGKTLSARMAAARGTVPSAAGSNNALTAAAAAGANLMAGVGVVPPLEIPAGTAAQSTVVGGVDVDALLNAAFSGDVSKPAVVAASAAPASVAPVATNGVASTDVAQMANAALDMAFGNAAGGAGAATAAPVTKVLVLLNMVMDEDLESDEAHQDLIEEVMDECTKFGNIVSIKIPRAKDDVPPSAIKKIFLEYGSTEEAAQADRELKGRKFGPNVVETNYFDEDDYAAGKLS